MRRALVVKFLKCVEAVYTYDLMIYENLIKERKKGNLKTRHCRYIDLKTTALLVLQTESVSMVTFKLLNGYILYYSVWWKNVLCYQISYFARNKYLHIS